MTANKYEVQVWQEDGVWFSTVYLIDDAGNRLEELDGYHHHSYLLNTLNYAGQEIMKYEAGR